MSIHQCEQINLCQKIQIYHEIWDLKKKSKWAQKEIYHRNSKQIKTKHADHKC